MNKLDSALTTWMSVVVLAVAFGSAPAADSQKDRVEPAQQIMESYFATGEMLAKDSFKGINEEMEKIAAATEEILKAEANNSEEKKDYIASVQAIQVSAGDFDFQDLKSARESYKSLSQAVTKYIKAYGLSMPAYSFYCPMMDQTWFQPDEQIANPFYGSKMLSCGKMTGMVKEGEYVERGKEKRKEKGEEKTRSVTTEHKSCCG